MAIGVSPLSNSASRPGHPKEFKFSPVFRNSCRKSMTVANITGGFRLEECIQWTKMYCLHLSRNSRHSAGRQEFLSCPRLAVVRDLVLKLSNTQAPLTLILASLIPLQSINHGYSFTKTRYENAYDVVGDTRYRQWLCKSYPDSQCHSRLDMYKYLSCSFMHSVFKTSCGRVLTSTEKT